jgi:hypothetical protein
MYKTYEQIRKKEKRIISFINISILAIGFGFLFFILNIMLKFG